MIATGKPINAALYPMRPKQQVFQDQLAFTTRQLEHPVSIENLRTLTTRTLIEIQQELSGYLVKAEPLACAAGCSYCCYLMATVSAPEALHIAAQLQEELAPQELLALKDRIKQAYDDSARLSNLERIKFHIACPFLGENDHCKIYSFRPLDCATHHSRSQDACKQLLNSGEDNRPTDSAITGLGVGIKTGIGQGLYLSGVEIPALRYELIEAVHIALNDRKAAEKYLAKVNIFSPAAIVIDPESGVTYKIVHAPKELKTSAQAMIRAEKMQLQTNGQGKKKKRRRR